MTPDVLMDSEVVRSERHAADTRPHGPATPPRLEVTATGSYYTPLSPGAVRAVLASWARARDFDVSRALETLEEGRLVTSPAGLTYRVRA